MPQPANLIKTGDEKHNNDPGSNLPFSPPPVTSTSLMSSPQGAAPKPLAFFSPIATPSTSEATLLPASSPVRLSPSCPEDGAPPYMSVSVSSLKAICQEDMKTPKTSVCQDIKIPKSPKRKNSSVVENPGLGSRKALFSTKRRQSKSSKAGLVMSVARVLRKLKDGQYSRRVGVTGAVYLASVLEYLVAEVLELAGNCARFYKKKRVTPRCIQLSLLHDKELAELTRGVVIPDGGVKQFIHPVLMKKGSMEDQDKESDLNNNKFQEDQEKEEGSHGD